MRHVIHITLHAAAVGFDDIAVPSIQFTGTREAAVAYAKATAAAHAAEIGAPRYTYRVL